MSTQIKFVPGKPERYISTKSFQLGGTGQSVMDGMEIFFDGTNVELNGNRFILPTLRGAITKGWLVRAEEYDPDQEPAPAVSANIGVRSANDLGQNPLSPARRNSIVTVESDERVVMSRGERTAQTNQRTADVRATQGRAGAAVVRGRDVDAGGSEFGVPVQRTFQTAARTASEVTPGSVGQAIRQADQVKIQPGTGVSEDDLIAHMSEEEREQYYEEKEARKADVLTRAPGYIPPPAITSNLASHNQPGMQRQASAPRTPARQAVSSVVQVGRVAPSQVKVSEGITCGVTTGGGTEVFDASGTDQKAAESTTVVDGITFRNTNGPKKAYQNAAPASQEPVQRTVTEMVSQPQVAAYQEDSQSRIDRDGTADTRRMVAKSLCNDFPMDYSFSDHWKKRLARIRLNYEERQDIIRAIFAAESDEFKKLLLGEFPEVFSS